MDGLGLLALVVLVVVALMLPGLATKHDGPPKENDNAAE